MFSKNAINPLTTPEPDEEIVFESGVIESDEHQRDTTNPAIPEDAPPTNPKDTTATTAHDTAIDAPESKETRKKLQRLYKSTRLQGYISLLLASSIYLNNARKSDNVLDYTAVPSTTLQKNYAIAVSVVSLVVCTLLVAAHVDPTPLRHVWERAFQAQSKLELVVLVFLVLWWSVAAGVSTSITGIAGDGKSQYSLYCAGWLGCLISWWCLEKWWVAAGWSSWQSFVMSWPYRAPAWLCIMFLSMFTFIWYMDLWQKHSHLDPTTEKVVFVLMASISTGQWQWLVIVVVFTFVASFAFVAAELFRDIKADGSNEEKTEVENVVEGVILLLLVLAWIPTVVVATTPGGAASLIGNAYFFTWLLVVFLFEALVWWIHDYRLEIHQELQRKQHDYRKKQREVLEKTRRQRQEMEEQEEASSSSDSEDETMQEQGTTTYEEDNDDRVDKNVAFPERTQYFDVNDRGFDSDSSVDS
jgi:hypothetical protein